MDLEEQFKKYVGQTSPYPLGLKINSARGPYLNTDDGNFLDLTSGIAVAALGYSHPSVVSAIKAQAQLYTHTGVYGEHIQAPQVELARRIVAYFEDDFQVFFTNSGAEANDLSLKMARKFTGRSHHAALTGGFHGRTFGAMSISWNEKYRKGFGPLLPVEWLHRNDIGGLKELWSEKFASVTIELIQGEAGAYPLDLEYVQALKERCDETGTYLIIDEVQTGFGRSGKMFAQQWYDIEPDFTVIGKAMGGGLPLGGVVASRQDFEELEDPPFSHVTTFGGNPLSCAAGVATLDVLETSIEGRTILDNVKDRAQQLEAYLDLLQEEFPTLIESVHGKGLLWGISFHDPEMAQKFVEFCHQDYVIVGYKLNNPTTIRIAPPLIINPVMLTTVRDVWIHALTKIKNSYLIGSPS